MTGAVSDKRFRISPWRLLAIPMLLFLAATLEGGQAQPPSSAEALDVLYEEDFEDGKAQDWSLEGSWDVVRDWQGNWVLRGREHNWARYTGDAWGDYVLCVRVKLIRGRIHLNFRTSGCLRYFIGIQEDRIDLNKTQPCGTHRELRVRDRYFGSNRWYEVRVVGTGNKIEVLVDGWSVLTFTDPTPLLFGGIAFETLDNSEFHLDNVTVLGRRAVTHGLRWVKTGGPLGGLGYDIRMHPTDPDILYVTDSWSGLNISTDGGRTWFASNEGIVTRVGLSGDSIPVFSVAIDPNNPSIVWVGTQNTRGIYKSTDGGRTWVEKTRGIVEREGISIRGITVHPRNSNIVYVAAEISSFAWTPDRKPKIGKEFDLVKGVVYRTTDGGESWTAVWRGDNLARYVLINPINPDVIYVSTGIFDREAANSDPSRGIPGGVGVLKSVDGGSTWRVLNEANGLRNLYVGSLFMHPQNPEVLLAATGVHAYRQGSGVYLTVNGGETWNLVLSTGSAFSAVEFAISNPLIAYAGDETAIYRSENGGRTWYKVTKGSSYWGPPGVRAGIPIDIQVDPRNADRLFVNNYGGGNFLSEDGGRNWVIASKGYTGAQLWGVCVTRQDSNWIYAVGRTGPFRSRDGGDTWEGLNYPPAVDPEWYSIAVDPSDPRRVLVADEFEGRLYLSSDGGMSWRLVFDHGAAAEPFEYRQGFKAVAFAPSNPRIVYAGGCRDRRSLDESRMRPSFGVYKSVDGGVTWQPANDAQVAVLNITTIAVHPRDPHVVYVGTATHGVFKTTNGGQSWRSISAGLRTMDVRAVAIDPQNPQVVYVGLENGGVYKSHDGGERWEQISLGMDPQASVRSIAIDPENSQIVYVADVRTGVYRSDNGGVTWSKLNDGLRTRAVTCLALSSDGKVLYAATEGEGVFRLDLSPSLRR